MIKPLAKMELPKFKGKKTAVQAIFADKNTYAKNLADIACSSLTKRKNKYRRFAINYSLRRAIMAKNTKPKQDAATQEWFIQRRQFFFEKFYDAAFSSARDVSKQKLTFSGLGIGALLALQQIERFDATINTNMISEFAWFASGGMFLAVICIILYLNKQEVRYNATVANNYDVNYNVKIGKIYENKKKEINKEFNKLRIIDNISDFFFVFGIIFAILFVWTL